MAEPVTLHELAEKIARVEDCDPKPLYQLLRSWHQQGLLKESFRKGEAKTSAALFDVEQQCVARIFLFLHQFGVSGRSFPYIETHMRAETVRVLPNGRHLRYSLSAAINGIREGERWVVQLLPGIDLRTGKEGILARCDRARHTAWPAEFWGEQPTLVLPLNNLLLPILEG